MAKAKRKTTKRPSASRKTGQRKMEITMSQLNLLGINAADLRAVGALDAVKKRTATKGCKLIRTKTGVRKGCYNSKGQFRFVKSR